ncbi:MAG TPA: hypothetical protein VGC74_07925 [Stenotrophomonas sp.]|jgi:hypothetical protein
MGTAMKWRSKGRAALRPGVLCLVAVGLAACQDRAPAAAADGTAATPATAAAGEAVNAAAEAVKAPVAEAASAVSEAVPTNAASPAGIQVGPAGFLDSLTGLQLGNQPGMTWHRDLQPHYLTAQGWTAFAPAGQPGTALAALRLDGSNDITAAELRIGRSDDAKVVTHCTEPPEEADGTPEPVELDGVTFLHYHAADAAMSHYLEVDGYRGLREGQCVAIDLIVSGTQPEVYDPPRQAPFAVAKAQAQLRQALSAIRWLPVP